jgi:hypothetical protein
VRLRRGKPEASSGKALPEHRQSASTQDQPVQLTVILDSNDCFFCWITSDVKRAERLCTLKAPNDAFSRRLEIKGSDFPAWQILDTLRGFEMVVASSNNGAVENVTEELPTMKAIADCWQEQALHFREVADAILAPEDQPDVAGICWGLIAAALGKKENRSNFADRFWNGWKMSPARFTPSKAKKQNSS